MGGKESRDGVTGEKRCTGCPRVDLVLGSGVVGVSLGRVRGVSSWELEVISISLSFESSSPDIQDGPNARTGLGETQVGMGASGRGGRGGGLEDMFEVRSGI